MPYSVERYRKSATVISHTGQRTNIGNVPYIQYRVEEYTALSGEAGAVGLDTGSKLRYYRHK